MTDYQELMGLAEYIIRSYEPNDHEDNVTDKAVELIDAWIQSDVENDEETIQKIIL